MLSVADTAAELAEHAARHDAHGYSQPNRAAVGTGATAGEWVTVSDGRTYGTATGDYDCSSLAIQCYAAQGVDCGGAWSTSDMERKMVASGNFASLPRDTWRNPRRGDLLLAPGKHVAVALGDGRVAEAVRSENHSTHGKRGDQDGGEIIIRSLYDDGWTCVLRYVGPEREAEDLVEKVDGAVYRLLSSDSGQHMFTASHDEAETLARSGWTYEGIAFSCSDEGVPVWRLISPSGSHMFTTSLAEVGACVVGGWSFETLGWISPDNGTEVRRLRYGDSGEHIWTVDIGEVDAISQEGWVDEGVAFFG